MQGEKIRAISRERTGLMPLLAVWVMLTTGHASMPTSDLPSGAMLLKGILFFSTANQHHRYMFSCSSSVSIYGPNQSSGSYSYSLTAASCVAKISSRIIHSKLRSRVRDLSDFVAVSDDRFSLDICQRCIATLYVNGKYCFQK